MLVPVPRCEEDHREARASESLHSMRTTAVEQLRTLAHVHQLTWGLQELGHLGAGHSPIVVFPVSELTSFEVPKRRAHAGATISSVSMNLCRVRVIHADTREREELGEIFRPLVLEPLIHHGHHHGVRTRAGRGHKAAIASLAQAEGVRVHPRASSWIHIRPPRILQELPLLQNAEHVVVRDQLSLLLSLLEQVLRMLVRRCTCRVHLREHALTEIVQLHAQVFCSAHRFCLVPQGHLRAKALIREDGCLRIAQRLQLLRVGPVVPLAQDLISVSLRKAWVNGLVPHLAAYHGQQVSLVVEEQV
mmetsp:Transcript_79333/g.157158  ORF Transcript_79333/g.157158 Transcript_79333/m.157158 type:complete len:304 (+) Transcript_79333:655-1566(+)